MDAAFSAGAQGISLYTVAGLNTKEKRNSFKAYADNIRELKRKNKGVIPAMSRPDYVSLGNVNLDPMTHPRLMQIVERNLQRIIAGENIHDKQHYAMNGIVPDDPSKVYPALNITEYNLIKADDRILIYRVKDIESGRKFDVLFPIYGGLICGWDIRETKQ